MLLALLAFVLLLGSACDTEPSDPALTYDDKGRVYLPVAYSPEKADLFERLVAEFNKKSKQYVVLATKLDVADILTEAREGRFVAASPDSAIWLTVLEKAWLTENPDRATIVGSLSRYALSPVVLATWQSEAQKMGYPQKPIGWNDLVARATADAKFRWTRPSTSTAAGLLTTTAEFYAASGKTSHLTTEDLSRPTVKDYIRRVEATIQQYGGESEAQVLSRLLNERARTLDALVSQEALVVRFNRQTRGEKLTAIYPREGTLWMDHPIVLLEGPWLRPPHRKGFQEFTEFLRSAPAQRIVMQEGYRPADLGIALDDPESQIRPANGVDPAQPQTMLQIPPPRVLDSIRDAWLLLKRPANIYLVADVSGSMEGEKLTKAKDALKSFIGQVKGESDSLGMATFSSSVQEVVPLGPAAANRQRLLASVSGLTAGGRTALYDAVLFGSERLHRQGQKDRINAVVVMTDGLENASQRATSGDVAGLVRRLQEMSRNSGVSVLVFTVAYGEDADLKALRQVSEATKGYTYLSDPQTIRKLYELLSAFFG